MPDRERAFQRLCHEAVQACGADVAAIERYVAERLAAMDVHDRAEVDRDVKRILAFQGPPHSDEVAN